MGKCAAVVDCLQPYYFHAHLVGSEGSLLDNKFHSQKLTGLNKAAWSQLSMKMLDSGDVADHPYQTQFQAFFDAVDRGGERTQFRRRLRHQTIIAADDRSARKGDGQMRELNTQSSPSPPPRRNRIRLAGPALLGAAAGVHYINYPRQSGQHDDTRRQTLGAARRGEGGGKLLGAKAAPIAAT